MYKQLNFCLRLFLDLVYNNPPAFLKMSRSYMYKKKDVAKSSLRYKARP